MNMVSPSEADDYPPIERVQLKTCDDEQIIIATNDLKCTALLPIYGSRKDHQRGCWERKTQKGL